MFTKDCAIYRAISLITLGSKVYAKILARRKQKRSKRLLWEDQGGFRPGKGCMIFPLRMITDKILAVNQKVFVPLWTLKRHFDRVVKTKLWEILSRYNVSGPLLQAIKSLNRDHSACLRIGTGISPWFEIQSDVKQGRAMSTRLINLFLDNYLQGVKQSDIEVKIGDLNVNCLLHADDAVFIVSSDYEL